MVIRINIRVAVMHYIRAELAKLNIRHRQI